MTKIWHERKSTETKATWSHGYYSTTLEGEGDEEDNVGGLEDNCRTQEKETPEIRKENDEVLGWTLDAAARGVAVMGTAVFVSSDLLRLAKEAAGCIVYEDVDEEECTDRIYGMRPSSILTNIITLVGLLTAVIMPLIGSIIDHTKYRRAVGSLSALFMNFAIVLQMLIMEDYWLIAAMLQIIVAFSYTVHLCAVYAYLPELTTNHEKLSQYATRFSASQYIGSITFLLLMVGILSTVNRNNRFRSSLLSQTLVFIICSICFGYAWTRLFRSRPASQKVPENRSLVSAGFWKIYRTSQTILLHHSAIKWFLLSAAFTQGAATTFSTIAITYMTEQLGFSPRENGIAILILLLFGVPGTRIAAVLTKSFNPVVSLQANLIFWIFSISLASLFLYEPGQQVTAYFFAMIWGISIGWVYPTEKTLYVTIIPRGQEAELMGTYICACQMLSWLPPLIFTVMNEMGFSMRIGLLTLSFYFFISFLVLFCVGDYEEAVSHAKAIDEGSIPFTVGPKEDLGAAIGVCYEQFTEQPICQPGGLLCDSDDSVATQLDEIRQDLDNVYEN
jgi:UMF1 family MFS transporter